MIDREISQSSHRHEINYAIIIVLIGILIASAIIVSHRRWEQYKREADEIVGQLEKQACYVQVESANGENTCYVYNSNNEVFVQNDSSEYFEVALNNGVSYRYTNSNNTINKCERLDVIMLINYIVDTVDNKDVCIKYNDNKYIIGIKNNDAIHNIYSKVSEEFAKSIEEDIVKSTGKDTELRLEITKSDNINNTEIEYYCTIGTDEYFVWRVVKIFEICDWRLDEQWYKYDIKLDKNGEQIIKMIDNVIEDVNKSVMKSAH